MSKQLFMSLMISVALSGGGPIALASESDEINESTRIYQDSNYIDKALDEYERRYDPNYKHRQKTYKPEQTYKYEGYEHEEPYKNNQSAHNDHKIDPYAKDTFSNDPYEEEPYGEDPYVGDRGKRFNEPPSHKPHRRYSKREQCEKQETPAYTCLRPRQMRRHLRANGWHDMHLLRKGPHRVRLLARNHRGRLFKLVIDRCEGHILAKRRVLRERFLRKRYGHRWHGRHSYNHRF